ncbi:gluconokinase [Deinococcus multiflagellatus]|uniref:Gluconokinase n=1 Tax=Deinococcus multiflagellatus TaxID=1656887 RepID=A0ABW1ZHS9_9DEIO|nr:gluconokinase, GntK/IdnK-type [Deinococcus multiflagellatus]MBZ9714360.1 AAA family ATPase [Deinococcus multiflagellatus]
MRVVVMGVIGSGKTALGRTLAETLDWPFLDADDYHSEQARAQMASGVPMTDDDRRPWLLTLRRLLAERPQVVLACSALRRRYRDILRLPGTRFVYLEVPESLVRGRLEARTGHFVGADLLPSQLAALEPPMASETDVLTLHVAPEDTPAELRDRALALLGLP